MFQLPRILKPAAIAFAGLGVLYGVLRFTPYPELARYQSRSYGFAALDRYGRVLRVFPAEDGVKREWATLGEIPGGVRRGFIAAEDHHAACPAD